MIQTSLTLSCKMQLLNANKSRTWVWCILFLLNIKTVFRDRVGTHYLPFQGWNKWRTEQKNVLRRNNTKQTVTWTYVLILSRHCYCLTTLGYPELALAAKDMVSVITFVLLPAHLHTLHSLFLKIRSNRSLCQSLLPVLK